MCFGKSILNYFNFSNPFWVYWDTVSCLKEKEDQMQYSFARCWPGWLLNCFVSCWKALKFPLTAVGLPISPFCFVSFHLMHFEALILETYTFRSMPCWWIDPFIIWNTLLPWCLLWLILICPHFLMFTVCMKYPFPSVYLCLYF